MAQTTTLQRSADPSHRSVTEVGTRTEATIQSILFPSDLSARSDRALDHARFLAEQFEARLTLCHVVEWPHPRDHGQEAESWLRSTDSAREHLRRLASDFAAPTKIEIERGTEAHRVLVERIRAERPDLVVMATHGRDGLAHLLLGSVTETLVRRAYCPILCVREPEHGVALPYRRILVPTDLSPASRRAFPLAALFARRFGAEVLAVHVSQLAPSRTVVGLSYIVETAQLERVDLIVMSTHGHDRLSDSLLGTHTERVVRHAPCPVLVA